MISSEDFILLLQRWMENSTFLAVDANLPSCWLRCYGAITLIERTDNAVRINGDGWRVDFCFYGFGFEYVAPDAMRVRREERIVGGNEYGECLLALRGGTEYRIAIMEIKSIEA